MQVSAQNIILIVVAITLVFLIAGFFIVMYVRLYNQRKKADLEEKRIMKEAYENQLLRSRIEVQEATITAISKDLHDNVGQLLSTTKMLLGITEINSKPVPDTLSTANATLTKAIQELRFISRSLDKEWLEQFDFNENLQSEIERINAGGTMSVSYSNQARINMKADEQVILFRIVQEAIQNAIKHAAPSEIKVTATEKDSTLEIEVYNNGKPIPSAVHGMGTQNMKHRVELFGGTIKWNPVEDGTRVNISLPIKTSDEDQSRTGR